VEVLFFEIVYYIGAGTITLGCCFALTFREEFVFLADKGVILQRDGTEICLKRLLLLGEGVEFLFQGAETFFLCGEIFFNLFFFLSQSRYLCG